MPLALTARGFFLCRYNRGVKIEPLGDSAYILRDLDAPAYRVAEWLNDSRLPGLIEAVASYTTVGLYTDSAFDPGDLMLPSAFEPIEFASHVIPVWYADGPDLVNVSALLNLTVDEIVESHTSADFTCAAVGFCPGFAYLGPLPEPLRGIPRRPTPRQRVEPGSVGVTGDQTAVYPLPRPGGWNLVGRTPLTLVDVADDYFPIRAGDRVRFRSISEDDFRHLQGERL
jgi:inhibitor of KinA